MKNILLFTFSFAIIATLSARPLNLTDALSGSVYISGTDTLELYDTLGNKINNGKITVTGTNPSVETISGYIWVKNTTTSAMTAVYVRRSVNDEIFGSINWFCFGPTCYGPAVSVSPNPTTIGAGVTNKTFYGDYYPGGNTGITSITYEFFDNTTFMKPVKARATIDFRISLVGIDDDKFVFKGPFPNPSSQSANFEFNLPLRYKSAQIIIRNILGVEVENCLLDNRSGAKTIDVSRYASGIYFYTFLADGKVIQSKKMIVKH